MAQPETDQPAGGAERPPGRPPPAATGFAPAAVSGLPWMVAAKVALFPVYFGISVLAVRKLGKEQYGLFSLVRTIAEYLVVLCALGLNSALIRFVPEMVLSRNKAGLRRLLWKTAVLQAGAAALAVAALWLLTPVLGRWFKVAFGPLLVLGGLLTASQVAKDYLNDTFTALFRTRLVSALSFVQALLWGALLAAGLSWRADAGVALGAQIASMLPVSALGAWLLVRTLRGWDWRSPPLGIGRERTLKMALPSMANTLFRMLMLKYTEVFFLGLYGSTAVVGIYDLGYTMPFIALTLIPSAVQTLLASAFSEAYARDRDCLGRLIAAVYKMMILMVLPLSAFGLFFSPRAVVLLYGEAMRAAGPLAAAFSVLHALPLISLPLSMGITAREKVLRMLPYMVLQVGVNLALDWLLIPKWGTTGAVAAVALTFIVTIPIRLMAVRRILGGIHFPTAFCVRIGALALLLAGALRLAAPAPGLAGLFGLAAAYLAAYGALVKGLGLLREGDREDLLLLASGRGAAVLRRICRPGAAGRAGT